jgi:hypothetical protein
VLFRARWGSVQRTDRLVIETRRKDHVQRLRLYQPDAAGVAEHSAEADHRIKFHATGVPAKTSGCSENKVTSGQYKQSKDSNSGKRGISAPVY